MCKDTLASLPATLSGLESSGMFVVWQFIGEMVRHLFVRKYTLITQISLTISPQVISSFSFIRSQKKKLRHELSQFNTLFQFKKIYINALSCMEWLDLIVMNNCVILGVFIQNQMEIQIYWLDRHHNNKIYGAIFYRFPSYYPNELPNIVKLCLLYRSIRADVFLEET